MHDSSLLEKRDVDELEAETDTRKLFLEQGTLEEAKAKEIAEYLDAKNKEVIFEHLKFITFFPNFLGCIPVSKKC